jgi:hypothetical protein
MKAFAHARGILRDVVASHPLVRVPGVSRIEFANTSGAMSPMNVAGFGELTRRFPDRQWDVQFWFGVIADDALTRAAIFYFLDGLPDAARVVRVFHTQNNRRSPADALLVDTAVELPTSLATVADDIAADARRSRKNSPSCSSERTQAGNVVQCAQP